MTNYEFDTLVDLIKKIAWNASGAATHQQRAGASEEDFEIEQARLTLVTEE